ncbi:hypothetical protein [Actinomadura rugatobispora]|uniref:Uncharacterized protein n=1 Tax=Actinomadura rugatobispora TaxID=1994 RepID=A0ABW0ZW09_9ACTN|nr:hypothetical protein GCM10010200_090690 [Actinomadura rugatobispora]
MSGPPPGLLGTWLHSHEEDTGTAAVYRPAGHPFRPSRKPRRGLEFRADGTVVELRPDPGDRLRPVATGRWEARPDGPHRLTFPAEGGRREVRVLSYGEDRLTLAK